MSTQIPLQYAVLRFAHDIVTDEFLNIGLALYSQSVRYFKVRILTRYQRITSTFPTADGESYRRYAYHLQADFDEVARDIARGQISFLEELPNDISIILKGVLIPDDSEIRFTPPYIGSATNLDVMFEYLYERLVERYIDHQNTGSRSDDDVWQVYKLPLHNASVLARLQPISIPTPYETFEFQHAVRNGVWNLLQPISFDVANPGTISNKAKTWFGAVQILKEASVPHKLFMLLGKPHRDDRALMQAYGRAVNLFQSKSQQLDLRIVEEESAADFAREIKPLIESHVNDE
ncbi:MAG: DUF3037 domain-containing protein [Chloroflexi bacterium]|nr:DUF3037 domain-containing protein [Chloroflexota bacterium]MCL5275674.1 DUF3037 domain-containing protein [Chloroflexota bacterium]